MRSPPYSERSLKIEGRDYLVQDRDCIHFRFNVCFHRRATARLKVDWIAASARVTLHAPGIGAWCIPRILHDRNAEQQRVGDASRLDRDNVVPTCPF